MAGGMEFSGGQFAIAASGFEHIAPSAGERDGITCTQQRLRAGTTDARACSGDDGDFQWGFHSAECAKARRLLPSQFRVELFE